MMQTEAEKAARATKRARAVALRDAAVDMVRRKGRVAGNLDRDGFEQRWWSYSQGRIIIDLFEPRRPIADRAEKKPTTYQIEIRFDGELMLRLGWDHDRLNLISYQPGAWERWIVP